MSYALVDADGRIVQMVSHLVLGTGLDCVAAPLGVSDISHYFDGTEFVGLGERPAPVYVFDYAVKQWVDPRSLAEHKAAKVAEINAARAAANQGTFVYAGKHFEADLESRGNIDAINGSVALNGDLPGTFPGVWKAFDNSYIAIPDRATWVAFYAAMVAQGTSNFITSETLKAQVAAATTIEQVQAIAWPA